MRSSILGTDDRLTIDQARARRQCRQRRDNLREAARELIALPREPLHAAVGAPSHDSEPIVLDLVNPADTGRRLFGRAGKAGLDEDSRAGWNTLTQHGRLFNGRSVRVES
jgi:hypothetical protein